MIETKRSVYRGALNGDTIQSKVQFIVEDLDFRLRTMPGPKSSDVVGNKFAFDMKLFDESGLSIKVISVNRKNIEYEESWDLSTYPITMVAEQKLKDWGFADLLLAVTVYRIGQHSYYTCDIDVEYPMKDEQETCCAAA